MAGASLVAAAPLHPKGELAAIQPQTPVIMGSARSFTSPPGQLKRIFAKGSNGGTLIPKA